MPDLAEAFGFLGAFGAAIVSAGESARVSHAVIIRSLHCIPGGWLPCQRYSPVSPPHLA